MSKLFKDAIQASKNLGNRRVEARLASINAIRGMMRALVDGLEGQTLKGAPNLVTGGKSSRPWRGYRVRTAAGKWDAPLPWPAADDVPGDEQAVLVIDINGQLRLASLNADGSVGTSPVLDSELRAEDAEKLANTLAGALQRHINMCERGDARYRRMRRFSDAIGFAIAECGSRTTEPRGGR